MTGYNANNSESSYVIGEFDWERKHVANLLGGYFYGYVFTQILSGLAIMRFGVKPLFLIGMAIHAITFLAMPVSAR